MLPIQCEPSKAANCVEVPTLAILRPDQDWLIPDHSVSGPEGSHSIVSCLIRLGSDSECVCLLARSVCFQPGWDFDYQSIIALVPSQRVFYPKHIDLRAFHGAKRANRQTPARPLQGNSVNIFTILTPRESQIFTLLENVPWTGLVNCFAIDLKPCTDVLQPLDSLGWKFPVCHRGDAGHEVPALCYDVYQRTEKPLFRLVFVVRLIGPAAA